MTKDTGGPAFPTTPEHQERISGLGGPGMTLRDWFATHAPPMPEQWFKDSPRNIADPLWHWGEASAAWAFYYADAMLAERSKP